MLRGWRFGKLGKPTTVGELLTALYREFHNLDAALSYPIITTGQIQNAANTAGVLVDSVGGTVSVPSTWTRFLNLGGTSASPSFLKHDKLDLMYDGNAEFNGALDITNQFITQAAVGWHMLLRHPDLAHGMTSVAETDVHTLIGARDKTGAGGTALYGLASGSVEALYFVGAATTPSTDETTAPVLRLRLVKKSGATWGNLSATDDALIIDTNGQNLLTMKGNGATTLKATLSVAGTAAIGAARATDTTTGFLYIPTCAGTPTGTPTSVTGCSPIIVDSTNNKLYFYSGGAWRDAGP